MKKRLLMLIFACSFTLLTGCSNGSISNTIPKATDNKSGVSSQSTITVPGRTPELIGKVKEIIGNEVTMFKAKIETDQDRPAQQGQERVSNAVNERQDSSQQVSFTEEEETFIIPVGIPVATMQRGSNEAVLSQLTDIKKDQIIRVWKTGEKVEFVQLTGGSSTRSQQQQKDSSNKDTQGGPPMGMGGGR